MRGVRIGTGSTSLDLYLPATGDGVQPVPFNEIRLGNGLKPELIWSVPQVTSHEFADSGSIVVPEWVDYVDIIALGSGGGGAGGNGANNTAGNGGGAGSWSNNTFTGLAGAVLNVAVGAGGAGSPSKETAGSPGNATTVTLGGGSQIVSAPGGFAGAGYGGDPGRAVVTNTYRTIAYNGGAAAGTNVNGNPPGGGGGPGSGGIFGAGNAGRAGGKGKVWMVFRNTL
ncbi:hypothetical protein SEA_MASELOP_24 [Rhodococcus phage Maselop]|nr:hypothetical protein SEA_BRAXOADDIE_24 [Rhodococcus phage Braxoaddie]WNM64947.1 hypothetical protein SEA_MASELOP_24 [Rhodococcus phage Maselop]WNM67408.1 hypothetical protein SEA_POLYYUKI_24 [Rhodococcus phage Polyyuki]